MIEPELFRDEGVLTLFPKGALTAADFAEVAALVDPYIESNGRLRGIMIRAAQFPGWDSFAALVSHVRFVQAHEKKVARVAVCTDSPLLGLAPALADKFVSAEVRAFPFTSHDEAFAWLAAAP
jgi:hypothetical protein